MHQEKGSLHLEDELSHLRDLIGTGPRGSLEAVQVVTCQDEVALLPAREDAVPLLPQQSLLNGVHLPAPSTARQQ